jgi:hypothetical protein
MRSGILRCYISTLKLRANAPFPSQIGRRNNYMMRSLRSVPTLSKTPSATRMVAWGKMPKVPHESLESGS